MIELTSSLVQKTKSKIVLLIIDGLGGLPQKVGGMTELETAYRPNMNKLAKSSFLGLIQIVAPGITPGSGAGHLAIFGYDPVKYLIGRGVLSGVGIGLEIKAGDVCFRGNFATIEKNKITDRRAGRISTDESTKLCRMLDGMEIGGVKITVKPEKEHRFVVVLKGQGLGSDVADTDPQKEGLEPKSAKAKTKASEKTAKIINEFINALAEKLKDKKPANFALMRGCATLPNIPTLKQLYGLNPCAIATYPMYKGLARLVGMEILKTSEEEDYAVLPHVLRQNFSKYDFFFMHVKKADSHGEDGNFSKKVEVIEKVDRYIIPEIVKLNPDVIAITGDHSTPAVMKGHSWYPVPFLLHSKYTTFDSHDDFGEAECASGMLGVLPATSVMPLLLANSGKLAKFGA